MMTSPTKAQESNRDSETQWILDGVAISADLMLAMRTSLAVPAIVLLIDPAADIVAALAIML